MTATTDEFTDIFKQEHRHIRDLLFDLLASVAKRDNETMLQLLEETAAFVGPHFRFEEETLYPILGEVFTDEYIAHLFSDHDGAILAAMRLVELAKQGSLSDEDACEATNLLKGILPHVSDCDGLAIMVETYPDETVQQILDARVKAMDENLDLISWAQQVRTRPLPLSAT